MKYLTRQMLGNENSRTWHYTGFMKTFNVVYIYIVKIRMLFNYRLLYTYKHTHTRIESILEVTSLFFLT